MKTIKSFQMFIGESNTFDNEHEINFGQINEGEIVPGVQLNPSTWDESKLLNNFYVRLSGGEVEFVGRQKNTEGGPNKWVTLKLLKKPSELSAIGMQGEYVAYLTIFTPKEGGGKEQEKVISDFTVKASDLGNLKNSATAANLLGGFLFASGTYISDSSFKNLLKTIVYLKKKKEYIQAQENGTFTNFAAGLVDALNKRDAFKTMKEQGIATQLAKRGGENFSKAMTAAIDEYKKSEEA